MRDYRAYIFGVDGHRFVWVEDFLSNHPDDAAALDAARRITDKHDVEVWDGSRLVARLGTGGEGMSPGLVPSLLPDHEKNPDNPPEPISLSRVSELALAVSPESNPFVAASDNTPLAQPSDSAPTVTPEDAGKQ
jgi:hypothetical protein